jgi:hypothetical protein
LPGLAVALGLLAFLPWASWLGFAGSIEMAAYRTVLREWSLWTLAIVAGALLAARVSGGRVGERLDGLQVKLEAIPGRSFVAVSAIAVLLAACLLSEALFARLPHHVDSIAQLFQARILTRFHLTAPAPVSYEFFAFTNSVLHEGRWFSQYPPGHPGLLAVGMLLHAQWLVNPLFSAGTVILLYGAARRLLGEGSARLAAVLYAISPFVLFMSASHMNHVTAAFFLALALYANTRATGGERELRWPLVLGVALAIAGTIRPLDALAWAAVLGSWLLIERGWRVALIAGAVCVAGLLPLFAYNGLTTGNPLRFGYTLLWGSGHGLGFHIDPWGEPFTLLRSLAETASDFQLFNAALFGWPVPSFVLLILALVAAGTDPRLRKACAPLIALLLVVPLGYFFYWHRDQFLGPRFLYASIVPAVMLSAAGIAAVDRRLGHWREAFRMALLASLFIGLGVKFPVTAGTLAGLNPEFKFRPEEQARQAGLSDAVIFVKVGWGTRLVARMWGWGISAPEAEQTYRTVDGCRLQIALDEADSLALAGADSARVRQELEQRLGEWRGERLPVIRGYFPDPSVRVDTTHPIVARCRQELELDLTGYTHYATLVWRNDPWLQRGLVFARLLDPARNEMLMARYPDFDHFLYAPAAPERGVRPDLRRLREEKPEMPDAEAEGGR